MAFSVLPSCQADRADRGHTDKDSRFVLASSKSLQKTRGRYLARWLEQPCLASSCRLHLPRDLQWGLLPKPPGIIGVEASRLRMNHTSPHMIWSAVTKGQSPMRTFNTAKPVCEESVPFGE